jgi:crossover junction endodeoxyribonuclease RuvC
VPDVTTRSGRETGRSAGAPLRVLGLDPSLTSFGAARIFETGAVELARWKSKVLGHERLDYLLEQIRLAADGCDLAVVEGAAVSRVLGGEAHLNLAGLHWLVRHELWKLRVPYAVVQPTLRQKYITGKGRADKDECLLAVERRFPDIKVGGNDQADALTLAAMGADWAGFPLARMPLAQQEVLTAIVPQKKSGGRVVPAHPAIAWPDLKGRLRACIA